MAEDVVERLLPCPFCGGEAECDGYDYAYYARCLDRDCIASTHGCLFEDWASALAAWNRRSPSPDAGAARREAIEECISVVDLVCKANFMMRGGLLLDVLAERLRALSPPVEGE